MPRQARKISESGWNHVILRGINRENLFYDEEDCEHFLLTVEKYQNETSLELAALCLMGNHVHLLMRTEAGRCAQSIKKIAVSYAAYYNRKYDRVGSVFQDRYRSEPVNDEAYLLTVARYIYRNPQNAGISPAEEYAYTRIQKDGILSGYFDTEQALMEYLSRENDDQCLEYDSRNTLSDEAVLDLLRKLTGDSNPQQLQKHTKESRDRVLRALKAEGASVRTISRLTGFNRNIVQRA